MDLNEAQPKDSNLELEKRGKKIGVNTSIKGSHLLSKFLGRYPEMRLLPNSSHPILDQGQVTIKHPAMVFVYKQLDYMKEGYTEDKAFEMVETEYLDTIDAKKAEMRILRGVAHDSDAVSYMDHYQAMAEEESRLKTQRLEKDLPKYLRSE
jgi:hypothetical protein